MPANGFFFELRSRSGPHQVTPSRWAVELHQLDWLTPCRNQPRVLIAQAIGYLCSDKCDHQVSVRKKSKIVYRESQCRKSSDLVPWFDARSLLSRLIDQGPGSRSVARTTDGG